MLWSLRAIAFLLLCCFLHSALADVTIYNFNGAGTTQHDEVYHHVSNGNLLDSHAGDLLQVGNIFYLYGQAERCGVRPGTAGAPWCGVSVYQSTDLVNWTDDGLMFDGSTPFWQTACGPTNNTYKSCYAPRMVYNASTGKYVLWIYAQENATAPNDEIVLLCSTPYGGCGTPSYPSNFAHGGEDVEAPALMVDTNGTAYAAYTDQANSFEIYVDQLNLTYTDSIGSSVDTGVTGEGLFFFRANNTYYVGYGTLCAYCNSSTASYVAASSPLGAYGSSTELNSTSCLAQTRGVGIVTASGQTSYIYMSDQWDSGGANEGLGTIYFQPLSFTGAAINAFPCNQTVTVPGLTLAPPVNPAGYPPVADQTSATNLAAALFNDYCDLTNTVYRMQTFVPTQANLASVSLALGQNRNTPCTVAVAGCTPANGPLDVNIVTVNGSGVPVTTLASEAIPEASIPFSATWINVPINITVTPGNTYGIELVGQQTEQCFDVAFNMAGTNPYSAGTESYSLNSGATWTKESGRAFLFSTYSTNSPSTGGYGLFPR